MSNKWTDDVVPSDLWSRELYRYQPSADWPLQLIHTFNLLEGTLWLIFAGLVVNRWRRHRHSLRWEGTYALAFVAFAASDFREAWLLTTGLLLLKAAILVLLLPLLRIVHRRFYPGSRTW